MIYDVHLAECLAEAAKVDPWVRATDGLNALVDAGIATWVQPDGHISDLAGDVHIMWDRSLQRWQLVRDGIEG